MGRVALTSDDEATRALSTLVLPPVASLELPNSTSLAMPNSANDVSDAVVASLLAQSALASAKS